MFILHKFEIIDKYVKFWLKDNKNNSIYEYPLYVDLIDWDKIKDNKWYQGRYKSKALRLKRFHTVKKVNRKPKHTHIHNYILEKKENFQIDHIDGNPLDNRRSNLRYLLYDRYRNIIE